ncbi:MAG: type II toxin-antitoxin system VapC family toxin [Trueperaceae bacterium]|nr:type II toxin-antitoxin system VapC family toxin [Trueperaceae bacterium]
MKLLLDTHVLLWLDTDPQRLSARASALIRSRENVVYISAIVIWELAIKYRLGKLPSAAPLLEDYHASMHHYGFTELPFTASHGLAERNLATAHKDPFDRALIAQAKHDDLVLISRDPAISQAAVAQVVW